MKLTKDALIREAEIFCKLENSKNHPELIGINDGKSIGTYIEHEFKKFLENKYEFNSGSSAQGIDFPDKNINTDLKVTSNKKPQNSCPFNDIKQKIYGLGYNLLLFIYSKNDDDEKHNLHFESCTFIKAEETGDYNLTKNLRKMVENKWDKEKIVYYLKECKLPGDDITLNILADEIIRNPPRQGYLTISNAFQWRLKYNHKDKMDEIAHDSKKEYGDYQTPLYFAYEVIKYVQDKYVISPDLIVEPTCGTGNFVMASHDCFPETPIVGIDINKSYLDELENEVGCVSLYNENIFNFDFSKIIKDNNYEYLVIGNPPWATNSTLSKMGSDNVPLKENFKKMDAFSSMTGMSNFDISESIILKIINVFKNLNSSIMFLCKYNVACNIFEHLVKNQIVVSNMGITKFNSRKVFNVDTSSCILFIQFNDNNKRVNSCNVYDLENPLISDRIGVIDDKFYSNLNDLVDIDGECCFEWRQGIKHDCSKVMELEIYGDKYKNKKDEVVSLEEELLYPLFKSSDIKKPVTTHSDKKIIVTQHKLKEDTVAIRDKYPLIWNYLIENRDYFDRRKSSIYRNAPDFSIFGVGDYTFREYKVAISGFYKQGVFSLVHSAKSAMFDDTCYYISFDNYDEAYVTMLILNSWVVKSFLRSIVFLESKRPYTKKALRRIDICKALNLLTLDDLVETEKELGLDSYISGEILEDYIDDLKRLNRRN